MTTIKHNDGGNEMETPREKQLREIAEYTEKNGLVPVDKTPRWEDCAVCGKSLREGYGYKLPDGTYVHEVCVLTLRRRSDAAAEKVRQDMDAPDGYRRMTARYNGTCEVCGQPITEGEDIYWKKGNGARHANCAGGERRARQSRSCYETEQDRLDVEGEPLTGGNEVYGGPAD
jgi:hypothetical protein